MHIIYLYLDRKEMDHFAKSKEKSLITRISSSPAIGIIHAVNSTILLAMGHFAAQLTILSAPGMPKLEVVLVRCFEQFLFLLPFILLFEAKVLHSPDKWPTIFLLSVSGYFCYIGLYLILNIIPLSTAIAISGTCPFFASFFSYFILKERIKCLEISCGTVGLIGVLLIARPKAIFGKYGEADDSFRINAPRGKLEFLHVIGCVIAVLFGASRALYLVFARKWSRVVVDGKAQQIVAVLYPSIFGMFFTPMVMVVKGDMLKLPAESYGTCSLFVVGILTSLGLMSLTMAIKTQSATVVGVIRNLEIVWAFIFQYFILGYVPSWLNLCGSALIVSTTILASFSNKLDCAQKF